MINGVSEFYDQLAEHYHLMFTDWLSESRQQALVLDRLIQREMGFQPKQILDCSCGIGTQSLGLATLGYKLHSTDFSSKALARAKEEAQALNLLISFQLADFRNLEKEVEGSFEVIISCDNALPHLMNDEEIALALNGMLAKLNEGGLILLSIRDYDKILEQRVSTASYIDVPEIFNDVNGRRIVFQIWDWLKDGRSYIMNHFIVREARHGWQTLHHKTPYRALLREELNKILLKIGVAKIHWYMPETTGYYQPIIVGRKITR